ncbi:LTA synthase family protein [Parapusillimonas granuli]|uniref:LTA synthase family protein n=1 Tax=Parapusillimonas granuli TaxID=380911 RepID=A0A853G287_9BURK|nr:LTA synthase family protein [Parapusillimonas granuli]MBB5213762.1 phosphoglycerol transferase MdoB-like AlkP superfamily enzyme [Parapusillimonas granuli]MEB2398838.1 LTA synthase family protein [Alcaligenaceae bacterium]NYT48596.1 LTA synthase family protein [Parapusillimonas granuli]
MRALILNFIVSGLCLLTASRLLLAAWQWKRVRQAGGLLPILKGGLRIDANQIAVVSGIPLLLAPWLGHHPLAVQITGYWFLLAWMLLVLLEVSTPQFIHEYDTRPNRLYVEYLKHPQEVFGMLWKGYKGVIFGALAALGLFAWIGHGLFVGAAPDPAMAWWQRPLFSLGAAAAVFLAIRGTLGHRPINPSTVAYCGDSMLNTLPLNSLYSVAYAIYSMKNERSASDVYGDMPEQDVHATVRRCADLPDGPPEIPTLHLQQPGAARARPFNLVMIVEESLGAQYVGNLGGAGLTPCLDELAKSAWNFTRAYATGTRSVRGLEAVVAGFPPTISDAALRLSGAQSNFFTMAQALRRHGYRSHFIYGGEAHFDNMKSFFLGNGFDELHDLPTFKNPAFVGTWGASDEDMFNTLHTLLDENGGEPTFALAFSVSNHSPWEYPAGRIATDGNPATVENTVRYADWSIGRFFEQARQSAYWDNTVFLIVADHDSRVFGANLVPLRHFHIPALILGAGVPARQDDRLISQIDLPTTLLSLIGLETRHPMIGRDLTRATPGRAMMQYGENYGYLKDDMLVVLEPHRPPTQYRYEAPERYTPVALDETLAREALAHVLWPSLVYQKRAYTLPQLQARP